MNRKDRMYYWLGILNGIAITAVIVVICWRFDLLFFGQSDVSGQIEKKAKTIENCIDEYYQGDVSEEDMVNGAVKGMVDSLGDKYSQYLTEDEYKELMTGIQGSYVGIGITLRQQEDGSNMVEDVTGGGPAGKAGIKKGDRIIKLDGEDVQNLSLNDLVARIKSDDNEGRKFLVTVERKKEDGTTEILDKKVVCEKVEVESIRTKMFGELGYIAITEFDKGTDEQFQVAMENMKKSGVKGIVFDVRNNGGGSLDTTIHMLNQLLPKGELITEKSKKDGDTVYKSDDKVSFDKPMVVLINGYSASASEVFAGTLKARGAARLVGTKSYGKGVVQTIMETPKIGGGLKLTTAEYFLPNGESIHKKGLTPDVEVKNSAEKEYDIDENNDVQLNKALELLSE